MADMAMTPIIPEWELHHRLARTLEVADISVRDMAAHLGFSERTMRNWLNGTATPRPATLQAWAMRCNVSYEWLRDGGDALTTWSQPEAA